MTAGDHGSEKADKPSVLPAALAAGAGAAVGSRIGPGGEIVGAFAAPYLEIMLRRSFAEFGADAGERIRLLMGSARDTAQCTEAELNDRLHQTERTRLLNITAINAAAGTTWPPKVVALGRVLAAGLIAEDEATIDLRDLALAAMAEMERPHVHLLSLLVRNEPEAVWQVGWRATPHRIASHQSEFLGGGGRVLWTVGRRIWTANQIREAQPQLAPALPSLLGTVQRYGLAKLNDSGPGTAKQLAEAITKQVNEQAGKNQRAKQSRPVTLRAPTVKEVDPTWSPTEFGEEVLGFYETAAAEAD